VQQAMAYGLPVIAAEADGTQNDLVQPKNGWLIPPGDPEALQNCLQTALLDSERLRQMGAASYQIVSEEVNLEKMIDVFVQVIRSVWEKDHAHITGG
jgi:glycosyltransferase involved in cell wall biosynthesis